ncbi:MAG: hypothetical protein CL790_05615 [Chloroflexi bacterium]|nr:hypothetical protein [Chloroflexota bacterium]HCU72607.1 hypothetical protein [Chloroflexota bacterium]
MSERRIASDILAVAVISAAGSFANGGLAPILGQIAADFSVSFTALGVLTAGFAFARVIFDLPAGTLADRIHPRNMFYVAAVVAVIGGVVATVAPTFSVLVGGRVIQGMGVTLTLFAATAYIGRRARPGERGRMMGVANAANPVGELLAPLTVGLASAVLGWRIGMLITLLPTIGTLVLVPLYVRDMGVVGTLGGASRPAHPRSEKLAINVHLLLGINLMTAATSLANFGFKSTIFPLFGSRVLHLNPALIGVAIAAAAAARFLLSLVSGWLSDRVGRMAVFAPGMFGLVIAAVLLPLTDAFGPYLGFALVYAIGAAASHMVYTMVVDRAPSDRLGAALGTNQLFADVATVGMPVALGLLIDTVGFGGAGISIGAFGMVAIGIGLVVGDTSPRQNQKNASAAGER